MERKAVRVALAGMLLVAATGSGAGAQQLPDRDVVLTPALQDVYAVGAMDGAEWETFGEIRGVAFDGAGNLYVLDAMNFRVTVVDPRGRLVRAFGTRGDGPGEFRLPTAMAVLPDGTAVIQDLRHAAYLVFGPGGAFQGSVPLAPGGAAMRSLSVSAGQLIPDLRGGAVYDAGMDLALAGEATGGGRPIRRVPLDEGSERTRVHVPWRPDEPSSDRVIHRPDGTTGVRLGGGQRIWEPATHVAPLPDGGVAVVDSTTWAVDLVDPRGGVRATLRRPGLRPIPVTERLSRSERERRIRALEERGPGMRVEMNGVSLSREQLMQMARSRVEEATFYHEVPVLDGLRSSPAGLLWLRRSGPGSGDDAAIDLVRWEGTYVGTLRGLRLPAAIGPDGLVAWIERDGFDVPRVVVRRMPEGLR